MLFPAGSSADVSARLLADGMSKRLGVNVLVVDRPGAGGALGYKYVAAQKPDCLLDALRAVLADHVITAAPEGVDAWSHLVSRASACCVHTEAYCTRSSMLIRVPRAPHAAPQVWSSDGPSCTHPLRPLAPT